MNPLIQFILSHQALSIFMIPLLIVIGIVMNSFHVRKMRKVTAPVPKLNRDQFYFTPTFLGHKHLFTEEQLQVAHDRSKTVHSEIMAKHMKWTITKVVLLWVLKSIASTVFGILARILTPLLVLFAKQNKKEEWWLPNWLWWFQTPDNPLDGDPVWRVKWKYRYLRHVAWLWRNAGYGLDWSLSPIVPKGFRMQEWGNSDVSDKPLNAGWRIRYIHGHSTGTTILHFYYVKPIIKRWKRCIRINLGYKLFGKIVEGKLAQIVCTPAPCTSYTTE